MRPHASHMCTHEYASTSLRQHINTSTRKCTQSTPLGWRPACFRVSVKLQSVWLPRPALATRLFHSHPPAALTASPSPSCPAPVYSNTNTNILVKTSGRYHILLRQRVAEWRVLPNGRKARQRRQRMQMVGTTAKCGFAFALCLPTPEHICMHAYPEFPCRTLLLPICCKRMLSICCQRLSRCAASRRPSCMRRATRMLNLLECDASDGRAKISVPHASSIEGDEACLCEMLL